MGKMLPVSAPFHCNLMEPAAAKLAEELAKVSFAKPNVPVVVNVTAEPNEQTDQIQELLIRQVTGSVRWADTVLKMVEMGVDEVIEIGAGKTLCGLAKQNTRSLGAKNFETPDQIGKRSARGAEAPADATGGGSQSASLGRPAEDDPEWERRGDHRVHKDTGKIIWDDGMEWDPDAPGAWGL